MTIPQTTTSPSKAIGNAPYTASKLTGRLSTSGQKKALPLWKRGLDLAVCISALVVALPIIVFVAIFIKVVSRGPVLFRQERVGFEGKRFECLKFRSMRLDAKPSTHSDHVKEIIEKGLPLHKLDKRGDARLIPLAWLIRASGVDELPQLINILKGDMSLVGPRPCVPLEYEYFTEEQKERFDVHPGLTGLWQVMGKNDTTFEQMVNLDITYARNRSFALDLKIIVLTFPTLISQVLRFRPSKAGDRIES